MFPASLYLNNIKIVGISILSALIFGGCTIFKQNNDSEVVNTIKDTGEVQAEDSTKLIVWGMFETQDNLQPVFTDFQSELSAKANTQVEVVYAQKDEDTYQAELNNVLNDNDPNTTPDIYMVHSSWLTKYKNKFSTIPENILSEATLKKDFHTFLVNDLVENQKVRGVPLWIDLLALVYNKKHLIADSGSTSISNDWNQFLVQAQNMTKYDDQGKIIRSGFSAGTTDNIEFASEILDLLFMQARTKPIKAEELNIPFNSSELEQINNVLNWYRSFATGDKKTWDQSQKLDTALFIEGRLSSIILPGWRINDILNYKKQYNLDLDFGISTLPQLNPSSSDPVYYPSYWIYVVSSESKNSLNAYKLLEFIVRKNQQEKYINKVKQSGRELALLSPLKEVAASQAQGSEYLKPYYDSIQGAMSWEMPDGEEVKADYIKLLDREITAEQLLQNIQVLNKPAQTQ